MLENLDIFHKVKSGKFYENRKKRKIVFYISVPNFRTLRLIRISKFSRKAPLMKYR